MQASTPPHGRTDQFELNPIELEILASLRMGKSNRAICDDLGLASAELVVLVGSILKNLQATSRQQLVALSKAIVERGSRGASRSILSDAQVDR
jgi:DNA-binding NarL/FixJ family response regulator